MEAVTPHDHLSLVVVDHLAEEPSAALHERSHEWTLVVRNRPAIVGLHGLLIAEEP